MPDIQAAMKPPPPDEDVHEVIILYAGQKEPRQGGGDLWELLHDLSGVGSPPDDHLPPCCGGGRPEIGQSQLEPYPQPVEGLAARR
jgi:hypothetical protein